MMAKGYAAEETRVAFTHAADLAETTHEFSGRFAALQGQFGVASTAGELASAHELALALLHEAESARRVIEAAVASGLLGMIAYWRGDFAGARTRCERAFAVGADNPDPRDWNYFGDTSTYASSFLAATMWQLGEVERARELIELAIRRASDAGGVHTIVHCLFWRSYLEIGAATP